MTGDAADVWLIRTDLPDEVLAGLETLLDEAERQRAGALLAASHRRRYVAAHGAARVIIGSHLGAPPAQLRWRRGPHGKPELAGPWTGVQVSLSHSGGLAALSASAIWRFTISKPASATFPCSTSRRIKPVSMSTTAP